jgi:type I restriction enzyme S subunit
MARKVANAAPPSPTSAKRNLPKGWRIVRFGDVVRDVNESERNPLAAGLERFIGLEHIEPENLHLKRWGLLADGQISFTKRFRKGQVLFGKRRAYQRKVAVAEFDGICSSDILTFEPKGDALFPELLPFIVQSDGFFEHALGTSSGSLSPRTRWSQLQDYEFPLPPKDEQCRIAEILRGADECRTSYLDAFYCIGKLRQNALNELYAPGIKDPKICDIQDHQYPNGWRLVEARMLSTAPITKGATPKGELASGTGDIPFIKIYNLNLDGRLDFTIDPTYVSGYAHSGQLNRSRVFPGDILMSLVGPPLGKIGLVSCQYPEWNINQAIARFRPPNKRIGLYLWYYLQSDLAQSWLFRRSKKTSGQRNLTLQLAQELPVPIPCDGRIDSIIEGLIAIDTARDNLCTNVLASKNLLSRLSAKFLESVL